MTVQSQTRQKFAPAETRPRPLKVLLVDDEAGFREMAAEHLESVGMEVEQASDAEESLEILKRRSFDLAVFDLMMPKMSGLDLLVKVKTETPEIEILILTAHGSVDTAVEAIRRGAHHYLIKPIKLAELQAALERAGEKAALNRLREGHIALNEHRSRIRHEEFLSFGEKSKAVLETADRAAAGAFPVLIEGETGTGKELIARFVHQRSPHRAGPLVAVNCGLLTENLLERELFGHMKGAFTGAVESRAGLFEAADGGTLFLDEIGEASVSVQVALLRAIETGMFRRIGESRERFADVRIIAASNRPLSQAVESRTFRADLFHRLNVILLHIPPLRERPEEILPLARTFLSRLKPGADFSDDAGAVLTRHAWPGNVREVQNALERAVYLSQSAASPDNRLIVTSAMLGLSREPTPSQNPPAPPPIDLEAAERAHIMATLERLRGDKRAAAQALGITLRHLYRKIKKYNLDHAQRGA